MSDAESDSGLEVLDTVQEPAPDVQGLALAEHYFGPLLSPIAATEERWTAFTQLRRATNAKHHNVFVRKRRMISTAVAAMEKEMGLDLGTLQKCVSVTDRSMNWVDDDPRDAEISVRIFSPSAPKYIDVHINYHHRARMFAAEWQYSIGYKMGKEISENTPPFRPPVMRGLLPPHWHTHDGWQSLCWGYYDDNQEWGPKWRPIEVAKMDLNEPGVRDIYETLFGPIKEPPSDDSDAILRHRRKLVSSVRFLLAAVGIFYKVACTDREQDRQAPGYVLEGLWDKWVARGIRKACGFQLTDDPEAEILAEEERNVDDDAYDYSDYYPTY